MVEWEQGSSGLCNGVGKSGNGTSRVWLYSKVNSGIHSEKDNSSVVIWLAHVIVVAKVRIQTSE